MEVTGVSQARYVLIKPGLGTENFEPDVTDLVGLG
jgi:hypothetical protein